MILHVPANIFAAWRCHKWCFFSLVGAITFQCRRHVGEYRKVKPSVKNGEYKNRSMAESQTYHLWHNCAPFYLQRYNLSLTWGAILRHIAACDITKSNMWYHKKPPVTTFFITCSNAMRQKCSLGREARHSSFRLSSLQNMADQNKQKTCMYISENKKSDVEILSSSTEPNHTWSIIVTKVRTSELRVGWEKCFITGYSLKKHWKSKANWVI